MNKLVFLLPIFILLISGAYAFEGTDAHGFSLSSPGGISITESSGITVNVTQNFNVRNVTKVASSQATSVAIMNISGSSLGSASFSGNVATFTAGVINLTAGNKYYFSFTGSTSTWTHYCLGADPGLGKNATVVNFTSGYFNGLEQNWVYFCNLQSIGFSNDVIYNPLSSVLTYPTNTLKLQTQGANFTANYSISGGALNLTNATYYIWNMNGTIFNRTTVAVTGNNTNNSILFIDDFGLGQTYMWNVQACAKNNTESVCSFASSNYTFSNTLLTELSSVYNSSVIETSLQHYKLTINSNPQVSSASGYMWYNGSRYSSTVTNPSTGVYVADNSLEVPLAETNGNKSFWWEFTFTLNDGSVMKQNTSSYNQTVERTYLVLCNSTFNTPFINFTTRSAENPFPIINSTFKSAWSWYLNGSSGTVSRTTSFEDVTEKNSTFKFCMSPNQSYIVDSQIEVDGALYSQNNYFLDNAVLNNNSVSEISIYLLNSSKATLTTLKVRDGVQNPIEDVIIQIQLYDVGTDKFYTVGMAKTSFSGEDIAYLNWYDSLYKFILIKDGSVIKVANSSKISSTPQIFEILGTSTFSFDKFRDFQYSLTFNNVTNNFVLTFTKPSGLVEQGCLRVTKRSAINDTELALICETSTSATLYYNIGNSNGTYIATFYATGSWDLINWISINRGSGFSEEIYDLIGKDDAAAYAFLLSGIIITLFAITPVLAILAGILAIIVSAALGFTVIDYTIFAGISIVGVILIWILKR